MRRATRHTLVSLVGSLWLLAASPGGAGDDIAPRLDGPHSDADRVSYRATGSDPKAPRPLVLWGHDDGRFYRMAKTWSRSDGGFDFGEQPIPTTGLVLHVCGVDEVASADRLLYIEAPLPAPVIVAGHGASSELILAPVHASGEFRIHDFDSGQLLLRREITPHDRGRVRIDLERDLPAPWPFALSIEQVLDDGRRSPRQHWPLD